LRKIKIRNNFTINTTNTVTDNPNQIPNVATVDSVMEICTKRKPIVRKLKQDEDQQGKQKTNKSEIQNVKTCANPTRYGGLISFLNRKQFDHIEVIESKS
jgi:hypothetical protein